MTAAELRKKFIDFFVKKGHQEIPSASLVPENDPTVLFTTAGMHPLIPYLMGEPHPQGKRLVDVQRCLRTDDIDEVGDSTHLTFFEMLGNWSLGDYDKVEAISWSYEFLIEELNIPTTKLAVTVFAGDKDAPQDEQSRSIWKKLGVSEDRIFARPKKDNWWGPVGETGPCGPDTEMFVWTGEGNPSGVPNENSHWVEVWNDVFMEYEKKRKGNDFEYIPLEQKNVDTGMGLERMLAVLQGKESVYETDVFAPIMKVVSNRIMADHLRAAIFLIADNVRPGNKDREYILRRLVRRAVRYAKLAGIDHFINEVVEATSTIFKNSYLDISSKEKEIKAVLEEEVGKFSTTLLRGLHEIEKIKELSGKTAFYLYESFGFPLELTEEIAADHGQKINKQEFEEEFKKHQELSRSGNEGKFAGGLADHSEQVLRGHTATHLLHQALRDVLGMSVHQTGSNITRERVRFDFSFNRKLISQELKQVEHIINQKVEENLPVHFEIMNLAQAKETGAIGLFNEKYGDRVKVYFIGPTTASGRPYSAEFCGGPHISNTRDVGRVRIIKEEALGSSQRRIYLQL